MALVTCTNDADLEKALEMLYCTARDMLYQLSPFVEQIRSLNARLQLEDHDGVGDCDVLKILQDVRDQLCSVKDKGNQYVKAAGVTASFVCESGVMEVVLRTLKEQSTEELLRFLVKLIEYLATCEVPLKDFDAVAANFQTNVTNIIEKWENEKQEAERNEAFYNNLSFGISLVGALFELFAPRMMQSSSSNRRVAGGIMYAGAVAAPVGSFICEKKGINSTRRKMILQEAMSQVTELCQTRTDILTNVQTMKDNLETVKRYIEGEEEVGGLKDQAQSPEYRERRGKCELRDYHKIITNLRGLERVMKKVLEEARRVVSF